MASSSQTIHESQECLDPRTLERHRAIVSLMEELEAIDWYDQRIDAATDAELKKVLIHNRDEEKEHAAMTLEWIRRNDSVLDKHLKTFLFSDGPIFHERSDGEGETQDRTSSQSLSLQIGSLKLDLPSTSAKEK